MYVLHPITPLNKLNVSRQNADSRTRSVNSVFSNDLMFQNIMAVLLNAGGLVTFTHHSLHWGSASTRYAKHSRAALEFVVSDVNYKKPYLRPEHLPLPPFNVRLGLTCGQVLFYNKRYIETAGWLLTSRPDWDYDLLVIILHLFQKRIRRCRLTKNDENGVTKIGRFIRNFPNNVLAV